MLSRIGDAAQSDRLMATIQLTSARLRAGQTEVATGKRAIRYDEIAPDASLLVRSKEQRTLAQGYADQSAQIADRLRAMDGVLGNLGDIAQRMRTLVTQRLDAASGRLVPLDREAETLLAEVGAQLNLKLDSRYLFAGSRIDAPPVVLPATPTTTPDPSTYYQGDQVVQTVRVDREVEIAYGLTADHPAFATLIRAIGKARAADVADDEVTMRAVLDELGSAVAQLAELRGAAGAVSARVEGVAETQRSTVLYLDEIVSRIEDADIAAVSFPQGLPGFPGAGGFRLERLPGANRFLRLRGVAENGPSFIVVPREGSDDLVDAAELEEVCDLLGLDREDVAVLFIVTATREADGVHLWLNRRAPVLIDTRREVGFQAVLPQPGYASVTRSPPSARRLRPGAAWLAR